MTTESGRGAAVEAAAAAARPGGGLEAREIAAEDATDA